MFELSFTEMLLAGVVALVVLGPERLPIVARTLGQWVGKIQRLAAGVKNKFNSAELADLAELAKVKRDFQNTASQIKSNLHDLNDNLQMQTHEIANNIKPPAWETLPEQKTPADFGVDESGKPLGENLSDSLKNSAWQTPTLRKQAMSRKRDNRPRHNPTRKLKGRR